MSDLLRELLTKLGMQIQQPQARPTGSQRKLSDELAQREMQKRGPVSQVVAGGLAGMPRFLKGLTVSDPNMPIEDLQKTSPWEKAGMLGAVAPIFPAKGIKGLYSRVERIAESLPESIHPNKLGSILRNRASQEEVQWRGLDKLMQEAGNKQIPKQQVVETLQKKPLDVKVVEKGDQLPDSIDNLLAARRAGQPIDESAVTQYNSYQMPGAKNYRETLIQLEPRESQLPGKQVFNKQGYAEDPVFSSHHWDEPNVLVHVRHNERDLRNIPNIGSTAIHNDGLYQGVVSRNGEEMASVWPRRGSAPGVVPELKGLADDLAYDIRAKQPAPDIGRMLENVQSDWHQRGAHSGYTNDIPTGTGTDVTLAIVEARRAYQQRLQEAAKAIDEYHTDYDLTPADILRPEDASFIWNRLAGEIDTLRNTSAGFGPKPEAKHDALVAIQRELRDAQTAYLQAQDAARRYSSDAVPDAPFKDSWAELALKQQLLDVADRPDLNWLGIAPQSELAARGEDISAAFQDVQLSRTLEKLVKPFGGSVEKVDLGIKANKSEPVSVSPMWTDPAKIKAMGLGPHGGFHEPTYLGGAPSNAIMSFLKPTANADVINELKNQIINQRPNLQSFIARLSPEMKQQIKEKGFPMLMWLLAMQQLQGQEQ